MSIAEKICSIYNNAIYEGKSSGSAYCETLDEAGKEKCIIEWVDDPHEGDYPSLIYHFEDGSSCYLSYSDCLE